MSEAQLCPTQDTPLNKQTDKEKKQHPSKIQISQDIKLCFSVRVAHTVP